MDVVALLIAFRTMERLEGQEPKTMMQTHQMSRPGSREPVSPLGTSPGPPAESGTFASPVSEIGLFTDQ